MMMMDDDPRSPGSRTPINSTLDSSEPVVVLDDVVIAEEIMCDVVVLEEPEEKRGIEEKQEASETTTQEASTVAESTSQKVITESYLSSPEYTPSTTVVALAMSPLNSPIGTRKRKDHTKVFSHSPLKKSYSAPLDENELPNPPSPVNKSIKQRKQQARTPLSPLTHSINSRHCTDVQPIKLRLDPTILG